MEISEKTKKHPCRLNSLTQVRGSEKSYSGSGIVYQPKDDAYDACFMNNIPHSKYQHGHLNACQGIPGIYVTCVAPVPNSEVCHLFTVRSRSPEISDGMWVRIKGGNYKGDLAQVVAVYNTRKKVTVKLISRIDFQALAAKFVVHGIIVKLCEFVELCFNPKIEEESQHHKSLYRVCTENNLVDAHPLPLPPEFHHQSHYLVTMLQQSIAMYHANENLPSVKGQWQKRKLIGRGTFGSVFHATNM
ncbi:hypothetical protein Fmac_018556 [Flemingia macrophylla]|uniref:Spt5 KOW domain-containing protein n=1 Tax=Flemingia macrophylla TaxID=520843 RepID=A0ABD1M5A7_9FABA